MDAHDEFSENSLVTFKFLKQPDFFPVEHLKMFSLIWLIMTHLEFK